MVYIFEKIYNKFVSNIFIRYTIFFNYSKSINNIKSYSR